MSFNNFTLKIKRKSKHIIGRILFHHPRVIKYKILSNCKNIIGNDIMINNNFNIISEGEGIEIGAKTLIGSNVEVINSDFHDLDPKRRRGGMPKTIGDNSVIANSSVVIKSIPANVIAGGYPCKVIKLDFN